MFKTPIGHAHEGWGLGNPHVSLRYDMDKLWVLDFNIEDVRKYRFDMDFTICDRYWKVTGHFAKNQFGVEELRAITWT